MNDGEFFEIPNPDTWCHNEDVTQMEWRWVARTVDNIFNYHSPQHKPEAH